MKKMDHFENPYSIKLQKAMWGNEKKGKTETEKVI